MKQVCFKNANIVDVLEGRCFAGDVLVEDGRIAAVGEVGPLPEGCRVVEMGGQYLAPGAFNCHTHITISSDADMGLIGGSDARLTLLAIQSLQGFLKAGVTFIRDVGGYSGIDILLRDEIRVGRVQGPDMLACGRCICITGGHSWTLCGLQADGAEEMRKATRDQLRAGADWIKVIATGGIMTKGVEPGAQQMDLEEMEAVVREAHKCGAKVCSHAQGASGIRDSVRAGIDSIEHGCYLDGETISRMVEQGTWFCPTLAASHFILYGDSPVKQPDYVIRKTKAVIDSHIRSFKDAYAAGVKICMGTDAGTPSNPPENSCSEYVLMVEKGGLTPLEALRIGTIESAKLCGVEESLGSVTPGKRACFAVYRDDPLQTIATVTDNRMTIKDGEIVYRA